MKKILLTLMLVLWAYLSHGQSIDSLYAVTYRVGSLWDTNKSPNEQQYFKEHSARLGELRNNGVIKFGARFGDTGMIVIKASSLSAAKEIILADIAVSKKLFVAQVQKLSIFYDGCLERGQIK